MSTTLQAIFWGIVTFSILVVIHEGGHFAMARAFGVHVHEFMLGLPGPSIRFHGKKTDYGVTAIPLGGYVRIAGMEPGPEDELLAPALAFVTRERRANVDQLAVQLGIEMSRAEAILTTLADWAAITPDADDEFAFTANLPAELADDPTALLDTARSTTYAGLTTWKRIVVLSAGVVVNLLAAVLVFVILLSTMSVFKQTLTIDTTLKSSGAALAGLQHGDTIKSFDGQQLKDFPAMIAVIGAHKPGDKVSVTVTRNGAEKTVPVTLGNDGTGKAQLGIQVTTHKVRLSFTDAVKQSFDLVGLMFKAIGGFFNPRTFKTSVSGASSIIGVSVEVSRAAKQGPVDFLFLVALLSLSLGAINILPIPPLDGGKVAIEIVQRVVGRPLSRNLSIGLSAAGTLLLFALIGYLMYADVVRYVVKGG